MRKILNIFLMSQLTFVAAKSPSKEPQDQIQAIQSLLRASGNEELSKTISENKEKVKELLENPEALERELDTSIDKYLNENLEELNKNDTDENL